MPDMYIRIMYTWQADKVALTCKPAVVTSIAYPPTLYYANAFVQKSPSESLVGLTSTE